MAAFKLPQGDAQETRQRDEAIQKATKGATEVPLQVAERTVALFERLGQLEAIVAASMRSDLQVARLMASAGARGALANVEINLDGMTDAAYVVDAGENCRIAGASGRCAPAKARRIEVPLALRKEQYMKLTTNSGVTPAGPGSTLRRIVAARSGGDVPPGDAETRPRGPPWRGHHRALSQGDWRIRVRRLEEGADAEVVSAIAGTDAPRALPAVREISGFRGSGSEFASR